MRCVDIYDAEAGDGSGDQPPRRVRLVIGKVLLYVIDRKFGDYRDAVVRLFAVKLDVRVAGRPNFLMRKSRISALQFLQT